MAKKQTVELDFIGDTSQLEKAAKRVKAVISDLPKNAPISDVGRSTAGYLEKPSGKLKPTLKTTTSEQNGVTTTVSKDQLGNISYKQHMSGSSVLRSRLAQAAQAYDNSLAQMVDPFKRGQHILKKASALEDVVRKHGAEGSSANARAEGHIRSLRRAASKEISSGVSNQLQGILSTLKNENLKTKDSNLHEANYLKAATSLNKLKKAAGISSKDVAAIEKAHKALDATLPRMGEHQFRAKVSTTAESFDAKLSKVIDPLKRGALLNKKAEALQGLRDSYSGEEGATTRKVAKDIRAAKQAAAKAISDGVTSQVSDIKTRLDIANRQAPDADTKLTNYANALSELNKAKNALGASSKDKAAIDKARKQLQADLPKTWTNQFNENLASVEASYAKKIAKITDPMKRAKLLDKQAAELQNIIDTQGKEDSAATRKAAASVQRLSKASAKAMSQGVSERLKGITNTLENDNRKETDKGRVTDNYIRASDAINKLKKTAGISQKDVDALTRAQRKLESYLPKTNVAASQERLADKLGAISHIMKSAFAKNASSPLLSKSDQIQQDLVHANEALSRINQLENQANSARAQKQISKARLGVQTKIGALTASQASLDHQEVRREAAQRANANMEIGWGAQFVAFGLFQSALDVVTRAFYSLVSVVQQVAMGLKDMFLSFLRVNEKFAGMETTVASALGDPKHAKNIVDEIATIAGKSFLPTDDLLNMYRSASVLPQFRSKFIEESSAGALGEKDSSFQQFRQLIEQMVTFRPDKTATDAIFSLREALGGNFVSLGKRFDVSVNTIANVTGTSRAAMKASPEKTLETLQKFFGAIISPEAVAKMTNQPTRLFENIMEQFTVLMPRILGNQFFAEVGRSLYDYALRPFVTLLQDVLAPFFAAGGTFETTYAADMANAVKNLLETTVDSVKTLARQIMPQIEGLLEIEVGTDDSAKGLLGRAVKAFTASLNWLSDKLPKVLEEVVKVIPDLVNMFTTLMRVIELIIGVFKTLFNVSPTLAMMGMIAAPSLPIMLASLTGAGLRTGIRGAASHADDMTGRGTTTGASAQGSWYGVNRALSRPADVSEAVKAQLMGAKWRQKQYGSPDMSPEMRGNYVGRALAWGGEMKDRWNNPTTKTGSSTTQTMLGTFTRPVATVGDRVRSVVGAKSGESVGSMIMGGARTATASTLGAVAGFGVAVGQAAAGILVFMAALEAVGWVIKKITDYASRNDSTKNLGDKAFSPVTDSEIAISSSVEKYLKQKAKASVDLKDMSISSSQASDFFKNKLPWDTFTQENELRNSVGYGNDRRLDALALQKTNAIEIFDKYELSSQAIILEKMSETLKKIKANKDSTKPIVEGGVGLTNAEIVSMTQTFTALQAKFDAQYAFNKKNNTLETPADMMKRLTARPNILEATNEEDASVALSSVESVEKLKGKVKKVKEQQEKFKELTSLFREVNTISNQITNTLGTYWEIGKFSAKHGITGVSNASIHFQEYGDDLVTKIEALDTVAASTMVAVASALKNDQGDKAASLMQATGIKDSSALLGRIKTAIKMPADQAEARNKELGMIQEAMTKELTSQYAPITDKVKSSATSLLNAKAQLSGIKIEGSIEDFFKESGDNIASVVTNFADLKAKLDRARTGETVKLGKPFPILQEDRTEVENKAVGEILSARSELPSFKEAKPPKAEPLSKLQKKVNELQSVAIFLADADAKKLAINESLEKLRTTSTPLNQEAFTSAVESFENNLDGVSKLSEDLSVKITENLNLLAQALAKKKPDTASANLALKSLGVESIDLTARMTAAIKANRKDTEKGSEEFQKIFDEVNTELIQKHFGGLTEALKTALTDLFTQQATLNGIEDPAKVVSTFMAKVLASLEGITSAFSQFKTTPFKGVPYSLDTPSTVEADPEAGYKIGSGLPAGGKGGGSRTERDPLTEALENLLKSYDYRGSKNSALEPIIRRQIKEAFAIIKESPELADSFTNLLFQDNDVASSNAMIGVLTKMRDAAIEASKGLDTTDQSYQKLVGNAEAAQGKINELTQGITELNQQKWNSDPLLKSVNEIGDAFKSSLTSSLSDFILGTKSAGEAFKAFAAEFISSAVRILMNNAVNSLFGSFSGGDGIFGSMGKGMTGGSEGGGGGGGGGLGGLFSGLFGSIFGGGGGLFAATGGEVFNNRIGNNDIQHFATGGGVYGGSGKEDDIPAMLMGGEFVVRKSAVDKYGVDMLERLNSGRLHQMAMGGKTDYLPKYAMGGRVGYMPQYANGGTVEMPHYAEGGNVMPLVPAPAAAGAASSQQNNNISITINKDGSSSEKKSGDNSDNSTEMARQIKHSVLEILQNEQRLGGMFRKGAMGTSVSGR